MSCVYHAYDGKLVEIALNLIFLLPCEAAVVGLERTIDQVSEDVGVVEVCVIVNSPSVECPIQFSFDVRLSTNNGTAGELITIT